MNDSVSSDWKNEEKYGTRFLVSLFKKLTEKSRMLTHNKKEEDEMEEAIGIGYVSYQYLSIYKTLLNYYSIQNKRQL